MNMIIGVYINRSQSKNVCDIKHVSHTTLYSSSQVKQERIPYLSKRFILTATVATSNEQSDHSVIKRN